MEEILYCGDARKVIPTLEDDSIDLVFTSPPYFNSAKKYQRKEGYHYTKDVGEPLYVIEDVFELLYDKVTDTGFFAINLGFSYGETGVLRPFYVIQRALKHGWFVVDNIVWHKRNPIPIRGRLTNSIEYIFILAKNPHPDYKLDISYQHNYLTTDTKVDENNIDNILQKIREILLRQEDTDIDMVENLIDSSIHNGSPTASFPVDLPDFIVEHFSNEGDTVIDPFGGIMTTALSCWKKNRNFIGIELNESYIQHYRDTKT